MLKEDLSVGDDDLRHGKPSALGRIICGGLHDVPVLQDRRLSKHDSRSDQTLAARTGQDDLIAVVGLVSHPSALRQEFRAFTRTSSYLALKSGISRSQSFPIGK